MKNLILICLAALPIVGLNAQPPQTPPCFDFNDPSQATSWDFHLCSYIFNSPNPLDNTDYLRVSDNAGGSRLRNENDFDMLAEFYNGGCICWDYNIENDGLSSTSVPIYPKIRMEDNFGNLFTYTSNTAVFEGQDWHQICAPIELASGGTLPSNAGGAWTMSSGATVSDFNNAMLGDVTIWFPIDVAGSSSGSEIINFDNICVKDWCREDCDFDFIILSRSNTEYMNPTDFTASVQIVNGNPNFTYTAHWGDGTSSIPQVSHIYQNATPNSFYTICIHVDDEEGQEICIKCMDFCFGDVGTAGNWYDPRETGKRDEEGGIVLTTNETFEFKAYPNPTTGILNVTSLEICNYIVSDLQGRQIITGRFIEGQNQVDLSEFDKGMYVLSVDGKQSSSNMILKE